MKKSIQILFLILVCSTIYAEVELDAISDTLNRYTSSEAPFNLNGEWTLLVPLDINVFSKTKAPEQYNEYFSITYLNLLKDGTLYLRADGYQDIEEYYWEHALSGPNFYILVSDEMIFKYMYYVNQDYQKNEPYSDIWLNIKQAWQVGQVQFNISVIAGQMMEDGLTEDLKKRMDEYEIIQIPPNEITFPIIFSVFVNGEEKGASHAILTRHLYEE